MMQQHAPSINGAGWHSAMFHMRTYIAGCLLALFVAGGVLAPGVHRVHHQADLAQVHAVHSDALDAVGPSVFDGTLFPAPHDLTCWLCNTHLVYKPYVAPAAPTPAQFASGLALDAQARVPSISLYRSFIRGPPMAA